MVNFFLVTILDWVSETNQGIQGSWNPNSELVTQFRGFKGEEIDATTGAYGLVTRQTEMYDLQTNNRIYNSYIVKYKLNEHKMVLDYVPLT